jgi:hypothetical protein
VSELVLVKVQLPPVQVNVNPAVGGVFAWIATVTLLTTVSARPSASLTMSLTGTVPSA